MKKEFLVILVLLVLAFTIFIGCGKDTTTNNSQTIYTQCPAQPSGPTSTSSTIPTPTSTSTSTDTPAPTPTATTASPTESPVPTPTPEIGVKGVIYDRMRLGITRPSAKIEVMTAPSPSGTVVASVMSDENGNYSIPSNAPCTYYYRVSLEGYNYIGDFVKIDNNVVKKDWELYPKPSGGKGNVILSVFDSRSGSLNAASGVMVTLSARGVELPFYTTTTNRLGEIYYFDLSPGTYYTACATISNNSAQVEFYPFSDFVSYGKITF